MLDPLPITVVVPAYNAEAYLGAALASVAAQTRRPAEVLLLDDGSTDATAAIARRFGVRIISQPNGGIAHARNVAIRAATMPWIALLDADDVWLPDRLERQWHAREVAPEALAIASDYALLVNDRVTVPAVMATLAQYRAVPRARRGAECALVAGTDLMRAMVRGNFLLPSSLLLDRRIFTDHDTYFTTRDRLPDGGDEFLIGEDFEWLLRVLRVTDVLVVERPLVRYRRSPTSLSANGGRLRYGDVVLGDLVRATPERYVDGAAAAFAAREPAALYEAAMRRLRDGDVTRARSLLRRSAATGEPRARALHALSRPLGTRRGARAFAATLRFWRVRLRPLLRRRRA